MAISSSSKDAKKENLSILEAIYYDPKTKNTSRSPIESIKKYFQNPKNIEKLLPGTIIFFCLAAIALGFFQIKYKFSLDFMRGGHTGSITENISSGAASEDLLGLRNKDTDQDGLSDYDEIYVYGTSPYLEDSDSDGFDDQAEIAHQTDPNCPVGQECFAVWQEGSEESSLVSASAEGDSLLESDISPQVAQLRQLLEQAGLPRADLDQLDDEEIIALTQEIVGQEQPADSSAVEEQLAIEQFEDLTPDQIRSILLQQGVSQEILDSVSDEYLLDLVEETISGL